MSTQETPFEIMMEEAMAGDEPAVADGNLFGRPLGITTPEASQAMEFLFAPSAYSASFPPDLAELLDQVDRLVVAPPAPVVPFPEPLTPVALLPELPVDPFGGAGMDGWTTWNMPSSTASVLDLIEGEMSKVSGIVNGEYTTEELMDLIARYDRQNAMFDGFNAVERIYSDVGASERALTEDKYAPQDSWDDWYEEQDLWKAGWTEWEGEQDLWKADWALYQSE